MHEYRSALGRFDGLVGPYLKLCEPKITSNATFGNIARLIISLECTPLKFELVALHFDGIYTVKRC
jgi:hypothetical protein